MPCFFTTKAFIVPHLRMLICGTGVAGFLGRWFVQLNDRFVVRDVDHVDYHAPGILRELWRTYKEEFGIPDGPTTTVYHFGFSKDDNRIHPYAYRSADDFVSEPLRYGIGVKPECRVPENAQYPFDVKIMMDEQRAIQANNPEAHSSAGGPASACGVCAAIAGAPVSGRGVAHTSLATAVVDLRRRDVVMPRPVHHRERVLAAF